MLERLPKWTAAVGVWGVILSAAVCSSPRRQVQAVSEGEEVVVSSLAILPVPGGQVLDWRQEAILAEIAEALGQRYQIVVATGLGLGQAVFGRLASDSEQAAREYREALAEAREAHERLQFNKALGLLGRALELLPRCGAELQDPGLLADLFLYQGLMLVTLERIEEAEAAFRQLISLDTGFEPPQPPFRSDQLECFERARRSLLSGNPTQVELLSWPEGAGIFIDGRQVGQAPLRVALYPGRHFVRMELSGHAPYLLSLPDEAPPPSIRAWLFPRWPQKKLPRELWREFVKGEALSDAAYQQIKTTASHYKVDAVLLSQFETKAGEIQLNARLYIAGLDRIVREGVYNLGADEKTQRARVEHLVNLFVELRKEPKKKPKKKPKKQPQVKKTPPRKPRDKPEPQPRKEKKRRRYQKPPVEEPPS